MKLSEIKLPANRIDEINLKQSIAAALIALSTLSNPIKTTEIPTEFDKSSVVDNKNTDKELVSLASNIMKKYKLDINQASEYVALAKKYEKDTWPKAKDILAVIGVESSFRSNVKSNLKNDPAVGLMQVRPGVWGLKLSDLDTPEEQIKHGALILNSYYNKLGNEQDALHAYNVGITNFKRQTKLNPKYQVKVNKELQSL
jgi:soluble lytic murein transglycosylase-like protein